MENIHSQRNIFSKITSAMFYIFFVSLFLLFPLNNAHAQLGSLISVPVADEANTQVIASLCSKELGSGACTPTTLSGLIDGIVDSLTSAGSALTSPDYLAYEAAQGAMLAITTSLVNSILDEANSFVRNLREELRDLENEVAEELGIELNLVNTCFPDLNFAPIELPAWNATKFELSIECSPSAISELDTFYNQPNGFSWGSYRKMALDHKRNNPFGASIAVQEELEKRTAEAEQNEREELSWGQGFRSLKDGVDGLARLPGSIMKDMVDSAFGVQVRQMENADEVTEALGSFIRDSVGDLITDKISGGVY